MEAEKYLRDKKRLSQALSGEERLQNAVTDITAILRSYNLDTMPETAFDVMTFALETLHLDNFKVSGFAQ